MMSKQSATGRNTKEPRPTANRAKAAAAKKKKKPEMRRSEGCSKLLGTRNGAHVEQQKACQKDDLADRAIDSEEEHCSRLVLEQA